jgi:hypothetical protein
LSCTSVEEAVEFDDPFERESGPLAVTSLSLGDGVGEFWFGARGREERCDDVAAAFLEDSGEADSGLQRVERG